MTVATEASLARRARWKRRLRLIAFSLIMVLLGIVVACAVAFVILCINGQDDAAQWVTGVLGVGALLSLVKELAETWPEIREYVHDGVVRSFDAVNIYLLTTSATLALLVLLALISGDKDSKESDLPTVFFIQTQGMNQVTDTDPAVNYARDTDQVQFVIPFADEGSCSDASGTLLKGADIDKASAKFIDLLGKGLSHCSTRDEPVIVDVVGFASSSQFSGVSTSRSNALNLQLAKLRAENVADSLRAAMTGGRPEEAPTVKVIRWSSYEEMRSAMHFNDSCKTRYDTDCALLNRRVEIRIRSAGDCAIGTLKKLKHDHH